MSTKDSIERLNSLTPIQREVALKILKDTLEKNKSTTLNEILETDYDEIPVDIDTFLTDPRYLGKFTNNGKNLTYRKWPEALREWFPNPLAPSPYVEVALTGAIGLGKSTNFDYAGTYFLYKLMCLKDPNSYYGQPGATLWFCFFNNTLNSANSAAYAKFQAMLQSSPWFMERGSLSGVKNVEYIPNKNIRFMIGSTLQHTLGINIIFAAMDEINFAKGKNISMEQSKIFEMYSIILERISSRFLVNGRSAGMMFLASSKQSQYDFLENYINKKDEENKRKPKDKRTFYKFDYPQWEVHPASKYPSGKTFKIACQNPMLPNKIIEAEEDTPEKIKELEINGYKIINVPIELYDPAKMSLDTFLMNTAGIASTLSSKYLHPSLYVDNEYEHIERPFEKEVLEIGLKDKLRIIDFFNPKALGDSVIHKKLYMHIDTSLTGDRTGISCIAISGYKHQKKYSDTGEEYDMNELVYRQLFTIGIQAPKGDQISFQKTREFIYYLKKQLGWNLQMVSTDGFQSADLRQSLILAGIPTCYISLDKTPDGYETFKIALQEQRAILILHEYQPLLFAEFQNVERNNLSGKIDHTVDGCFTEDTRIRLVDGRILTIKELLLEQQYKDNYVYTFNEEKKIIEPKRIRKVFQTKITKDLVKVTLDNGETITCTPNHRFMLRDGSYEEIQNIKPGTSLMPLYTKFPSGNLSNYRMYYEPIEEQWHFEHRRFCNNIIHNKDYVVHHCNYNKLDNTPKNLDCITKKKHTWIHNNHTLDYNKISKSVKEYHKRNKDTTLYKEIHKRQAETLHNKYKELNKDKLKEQEDRRILFNKIAKEQFGIDCYDNLSLNEKYSIGPKIAMYLDSTIKERISKSISEKHKLGKYKNCAKACSMRMWVTNGEDSIYILKTDKIPDGYYKGRIIKRNKKEYKNHKVVSIEKINKPCRVYDLEIEDNHNFALDAGIFVHNSKDLLDSLVGSIYSASKNIKPEEIYSLENYDVLLQANTDETRISANPINNLFFKPPEETVKTYAEKQNEKMDLEVQTIKKLRAEMTREENMNITDAQLLEMLSNSTLDDDMLIF